jgi:hypothetical protein
MTTSNYQTTLLLYFFSEHFLGHVSVDGAPKRFKQSHPAIAYTPSIAKLVAGLLISELADDNNLETAPEYNVVPFTQGRP